MDGTFNEVTTQLSELHLVNIVWSCMIEYHLEGFAKFQAMWASWHYVTLVVAFGLYVLGVSILYHILPPWTKQVARMLLDSWSPFFFLIVFVTSLKQEVNEYTDVEAFCKPSKKATKNWLLILEFVCL